MLLKVSDTAGKLTWWRLRLLESEFDIVHCAGIKHQAADSPSTLQTKGAVYTKLEEEVPVLNIHLEIFLLVYNVETKVE